MTTINKQWTATVEAVNLAAAEQKLPPLPAALKLYCARHTFGTDMLAEGMDIVKVSKLMGHEDLKTTMKSCTRTQVTLLRSSTNAIARSLYTC